MPILQGMETITQPLYDTIAPGGAAIAAGTILTFFSVPLGQGTTAIGAAGVKTQADTNMLLAGALPAPWEYDIHAIGVQTDPAASVADVTSFFRNTWLRFTVGPKDWLVIPCSALPPGTGGQGYISTTAAATTTGQNGWGAPDPRAMFTLSRPIHLNPQESFNVFLTFAAAMTFSAAAASPIRLWLHGEQTRTT